MHFLKQQSIFEQSEKFFFYYIFYFICNVLTLRFCCCKVIFAKLCHIALAAGLSPKDSKKRIARPKSLSFTAVPNSTRPSSSRYVYSVGPSRLFTSDLPCFEIISSFVRLEINGQTSLYWSNNCTTWSQFYGKEKYLKW